MATETISTYIDPFNVPLFANRHLVALFENATYCLRPDVISCLEDADELVEVVGPFAETQTRSGLFGSQLRNLVVGR